MRIKSSANSRPWFVYILECKNKSFYTGITSNLERRLREHLKGRGGHYTRTFGAVRFVYTEECPSREEALRREIEIKTWPRAKKLVLVGISS